MAANMFGDGEVFDLPCPYVGGVTSGQGMLVGARLFGVAMANAAQNQLVATRFHGIYDLAKEPSLVVAQGARLWWDNTNRRLTATATSNMAVAIAVAASGATETTVRVLVTPHTAAAA
jgi:predicted RecA/RadA family phage recombinase